jgi:hypothetical protein
MLVILNYYFRDGIFSIQPNPTLGWIGFWMIITWVGLDYWHSKLEMNWEIFFLTWNVKTWNTTPLEFSNSQLTASLWERTSDNTKLSLKHQPSGQPGGFIHEMMQYASINQTPKRKTYRSPWWKTSTGQRRLWFHGLANWTMTRGWERSTSWISISFASADHPRSHRSVKPGALWFCRNFRIEISPRRASAEASCSLRGKPSTILCRVSHSADFVNESKLSV